MKGTITITAKGFVRPWPAVPGVVIQAWDGDTLLGQAAGGADGISRLSLAAATVQLRAVPPPGWAIVASRSWRADGRAVMPALIRAGQTIAGTHVDLIAVAHAPAQSRGLLLWV